MEDGKSNKRKLLIINQDGNDKATSSADVDIYRQKISRLELTISELQKKLREFESTPILKILHATTTTSGTRKTEIYQDALLNIQLQALRQKETERIMMISNLQSELDRKKSHVDNSKVLEELRRENEELRVDLRKERHLNQDLTAKSDKLAARNAQLRQSVTLHQEDNNRLATQLFFSSQMQEHLQQQLQQIQIQSQMPGVAEGKSSEVDDENLIAGPESTLMDLDALLSGVVVGGLDVDEGDASPVLRAEEDDEPSSHTPVLNMDDDDDDDGSPVLVAEDD
eukprot:gene30133-39330_t